jgi:hypothetical protein
MVWCLAVFPDDFDFYTLLFEDMLKREWPSLRINHGPAPFWELCLRIPELLAGRSHLSMLFSDQPWFLASSLGSQYTANGPFPITSWAD